MNEKIRPSDFELIAAAVLLLFTLTALAIGVAYLDAHGLAPWVAYGIVLPLGLGGGGFASVVYLKSRRIV